MDPQKVEMYLMSNSKYFESHQMAVLHDVLLKADDSKIHMLHSIDLKDPVLIFIVSLIAGSLGIDRFLIGDTGMGVGKLLTCGGLGIWAIVDWFLIMGRTKEINYNKIMSAML